VKQILIVDDSVDLQMLLAQFFKSEGFKVLQASDGKAALSILESSVTLPTLVLLDVMMPVMDGLEMKAEMNKHSRFSSIPVVWMSADAGSLKKELNRVGELYCQKPLVNLIELLAVIGRIKN